MMKLVVNADVIAGYNRFHTPRHRIKDTLDVTSGYSSPCSFHRLPKLIWCSIGGRIPESRCASNYHTFRIGDRSIEQAGQRTDGKPSMYGRTTRVPTSQGCSTRCSVYRQCTLEECTNEIQYHLKPGYQAQNQCGDA
ncbi:hypothetical protein TNCV_3157251 [Trichonephila clavipes]|nr:hypothetical protein TNCV_3157251 [Trichonephila clavipes]